MWAFLKLIPQIIVALPQIISAVRDVLAHIERWKAESELAEANKKIEEERAERLKAVEGAQTDEEFDEAIRDSLRR